MSEREQDAAVIAKSAQRHADLRALTTLRCVRIEETALLVRVANAGADLIQAQYRELDRLTAERDAAHEKIVSFGSTMADLIMLRSENERLEAETVEYAAILEKAVKESKALVAGYNKAIEERNAARAENTRLRAHITKIAEACEMVASSLEANLGYSTGKPYFWSGDAGREIVQHTLSNAVNNLRAALESEADHD